MAVEGSLQPDPEESNGSKPHGLRSQEEKEKCAADQGHGGNAQEGRVEGDQSVLPVQGDVSKVAQGGTPPGADATRVEKV